MLNSTKKSIDLSKEKIRYVAIGDSISEGYNGQFKFGYAGTKVNKKITGTSWPSFFARNIVKINANILESYENFALSGTRPEDWNYFLGVKNKKYSYENSKNKIKFAIKLNNESKNPEKRRIRTLFKDFGKKNQNDFNYLLKTIKKANLITFNIGANYLIPKIPFNEVINWLVSEDVPVKKIHERIIEVISSVEEDTIAMVNRIKELNPNCLIVFVGYVLPFNPVFNLINDNSKKLSNISSNGLVPLIANELNNALKNVAKKTKINYVDIFNEEFWYKNNKTLSEIFYEIHPVVKGYKKIAQDVLVKISLSNDFFSKKNEEIVEKIPTFNEEYLKKDRNLFKNCLNFSSLNISDEELINLIYGANNDILKRDSKIEIDSNLLKSNLNPEQYIDEGNNPNDLVKINVIKAIRTITNGNIDSNELIENKSIQKSVISFLKDSKILSFVTTNIQNEINFFYKNGEEISSEKFIEIILKSVFNIDNFFKIIKYSLVYLYNNRKTLKNFKKIYNLIVNFLVSLPKNKSNQKVLYELTNYIIKNINKNFHLNIKYDDLIKMIDVVVKDNNFSKIIEEMITHGLKHIHTIKNLKTSKQLLNFFIQNDYKTFSATKLLSQILSNVELRKIISKQLINILNLEYNEENIEIFNNFLETALKIEIIEDVFIEILINIITSKTNTFAKRGFTNLIMNLDKKHFWDKLKKIDYKKVDVRKKDINNLTNLINIMCSNSEINSTFYDAIRNTTYPDIILNSKTNKPNRVLLLKIINKIHELIKSLGFIFEKLFDSYLQNNKNKEKIDKEDPYYKAIFRLLLICLVTSFKSFQGTMKLNIFWTKNNFFIIPTIIGIFLKMLVKDKDKNDKDYQFFIEMLGEEKENSHLKLNCNEKNYEPSQLLWYIVSMYTTPIDKHTNKSKIDVILESIKKGYWIV